MRRPFTIILFLTYAMSIGCQDAEQQKRNAIRKNLDQLGQSLDKYNEEQSQAVATEVEPTHVIATDTVYYKGGPQQAQPPDGTFKTGTKVTLIEDAGSYTLIRSTDGVEAYVAADAMTKIESKAPTK